MIRRQGQEEENGQNGNNIPSVMAKLQKLQGKSQKMYESIEEVMGKTIDAIRQSELEIEKASANFGDPLMNLHVKMTEIKPLKSLKDQYNDFYKKLSGFGKTIDEMPVEGEIKIKVPKLFEDSQLKSIEESLSDHYLSQQNYDVALSIHPENTKRKLFEECFQLRSDILASKFDRPAQWVEKLNCNMNDHSQIAYQIHKMKTISLVNENKAGEAIAYLRKNLSSYASQNGNQIAKLMNFIITQSDQYWGGMADYSNIYKDRYQSFVKVELEELANKFTDIYLKINNIYLVSPIAQCHEVGLKFRDQFLQHLKYLPENQELPTVLPFSIKTGSEYKYHSYFFCPVSKEVFGPLDKNTVLSCGHMVSGHAISKLTQGKDARRKMKCPVCQSDQIIENNMRVQF